MVRGATHNVAFWRDADIASGPAMSGVGAEAVLHPGGKFNPAAGIQLRTDFTVRRRNVRRGVLVNTRKKAAVRAGDAAGGNFSPAP